MTVLSKLRRLLPRQDSAFAARLERVADRQLILQARSLAQANRTRATIPALHDVEFSAYSQWGEDGIIDWLVERLPGVPRIFVEFGVGDYREANTRLLLEMRHWRGLILDGSSQHIADIQGQELYWRHELQATQAFIDRENINQLIRAGGVSGDIGLLSIDIDGNDYWVWKAIDVVNPALVIVEYNAVFGDLNAVTVPYDALFQRAHAHHSLLYFGASLPALIELGMRKGYHFLGTGLAGCNAFFARADIYADLSSSIRSIRGYPTLAREARDENGNLAFTSGAARARLIEALPVVDLTRGTEMPLRALGPLYSPAWLAGEPRAFSNAPPAD